MKNDLSYGILGDRGVWGRRGGGGGADGGMELEVVEGVEIAKQYILSVRTTGANVYITNRCS